MYRNQNVALSMILCHSVTYSLTHFFPGPKIKQNRREHYETTTVHRDLCTVDYFVFHERQQQQQQNSWERGILQIKTKFLNFYFWSNFWPIALTELSNLHDTFPGYHKLPLISSVLIHLRKGFKQGLLTEAGLYLRGIITGRTRKRASAWNML